jgi:HEAT repeat protein
MNNETLFETAFLRLVLRVALVFLASTGAALAQTPQQDAWDLLRTGVKSRNTTERASSVNVLGLLPNNRRATKFAEGALTDTKEKVRVAAATALGEMKSRGSIPKLKDALNDKETSVVLAAAHSLQVLGDPAAYEVYYAILTGERKSGKGLLADQVKMLKDPKQMAQFGFEQGIGFIPYAGMGWEVYKTLAKDDSSPVRAAAAKKLASDPDPGSGEALAEAVHDKSWLVRAAALDAIARRGDPALLDKIVPALTDEKDTVRYTAAAAIIRLAGAQKKDTHNK